MIRANLLLQSIRKKNVKKKHHCKINTVFTMLSHIKIIIISYLLISARSQGGKAIFVTVNTPWSLQKQPSANTQQFSEKNPFWNSYIGLRKYIKYIKIKL